MTRVRIRTLSATSGAVALLAIAAAAAASGSWPSATTVRGRQTIEVQVVRETENTHINSVSFVDLPGASVTITVPDRSTALLLAGFSAESQCAVVSCHVRILVNDVEMEPAVGFDFSFDRGVDSDDEVESNSMDRSFGPVGPGTYIVKVQAATSQENQNPITFELDDWSLTVERVATGLIPG